MSEQCCYPHFTISALPPQSAGLPAGECVGKGNVYSPRVPREDADPQDVPDAFPFTGISLLIVYLFLSMSNFFHFLLFSHRHVPK